jgi:hypothetical protein
MEDQSLATPGPESVQQPAPARKASKRGRGAIYKGRQVVSLRLPPALHAELLAFADEHELVLNTYITGLVAADLAERRTLSRAKVRKK